MNQTTTHTHYSQPTTTRRPFTQWYGLVIAIGVVGALVYAFTGVGTGGNAPNDTPISASLAAQQPTKTAEAGPNWRTWDQAYAEYTKSGNKKIILIDAYTDWCGWCKVMDKKTYTNESVIKVINEKFIPVKINPEQADKTYLWDGKQLSGREILTTLAQSQIRGFPSTIFALPGKPLLSQAIPGYQDHNQFLETLSQIEKFAVANQRAGN